MYQCCWWKKIKQRALQNCNWQTNFNFKNVVDHFTVWIALLSWPIPQLALAQIIEVGVEKSERNRSSCHMLGMVGHVTNFRYKNKKYSDKQRKSLLCSCCASCTASCVAVGVVMYFCANEKVCRRPFYMKRVFILVQLLRFVFNFYELNTALWTLQLHFTD